MKQIIAHRFDATFERVRVATALERQSVASLVDNPVMKRRIGDDVLNVSRQHTVEYFLLVVVNTRCESEPVSKKYIM